MIIAGFGLYDSRGSPPACLWGDPLHTRAGHSPFSPNLSASPYAPSPREVRAERVCPPVPAGEPAGGAGPRSSRPANRPKHPPPAPPPPARMRVGPSRALFLGTSRFPAERQINIRARPCPCVRGPAACVTRKRAPGPPPPPPPPNPQQGAEPAAAAAAAAAAVAARPLAPAQARPRPR